jgi:cell division protein FtsW
MFKFKVDRYIFFTTLAYALFGFAMFFSASLGVMVRYEDKFYAVVNNQFFYGLLLGLTAFILGAYVNFNIYKRLSYFIYGFSFFLCLLVFIPGLGIEIKNSTSWLSLFGFTFQPSEILKYASILFISYFYCIYQKRTEDFKYRLFPIAILSLSTLAVILQPDMGTAVIIITGIAATFFILAATPRDMIIGSLAVFIVLAVAYFALPHISSRVQTFFSPSSDTLGGSYQINQAAIAMGSGHIFGEGYDQGTQKYHNLPEPIGDSVFAVVGEEMGFMGSMLIILFILFICFRLLYLAQMSPDIYIRGVLTGTAVIILTQSFLNIGSITNAIPLTGVPLPLVSHGSTSLIITLGMLGLCSQLAGVSKKYKVRK